MKWKNGSELGKFKIWNFKFIVWRIWIQLKLKMKKSRSIKKIKPKNFDLLKIGNSIQFNDIIKFKIIHSSIFISTKFIKIKTKTSPFCSLSKLTNRNPKWQEIFALLLIYWIEILNWNIENWNDFFP